MKANRAKAGLKIGLRWKDGRFIREDEKSAVSVMQGAADEELFLELLDKSTRNGIDVHVAPGRGYAPDSFAEQERARELGVGKERFKRAMQRLLDSERIRNEEFGPPSKRRHKLVRTRPSDDVPF